MDYTYLEQFATGQQKQYLTALSTSKNLSQAAKSLGITHQKLNRELTKLKITAAEKGLAPDNGLTHAVPDPFVVKGYSTFYDQDGEIKAQWIKTKVDDLKRQELVKEALQAMADELPRVEPIPFKSQQNDDLCNMVVFSDYHLGMYSRGTQFDDPWNLVKAESLLMSCYVHMITQLPAASNIVICFNGDTLHTDSILPLTPAHKNVLQADGSFHHSVTAVIRVMRNIVNFALERFKSVHLMIVEGNHDEASSILLRGMFAATYEHESRLTVSSPEIPFYVYQHGNVMLGAHHGHKVKNEQLPLLFASQFPKIWGSTTKRYCHTGHRHHLDEKEYSGMIVTQHPTLSPRDDHASRGGWISNRSAMGITYHKRFGKVSTTIVCPEMFQ
jgi:hypothetical protein